MKAWLIHQAQNTAAATAALLGERIRLTATKEKQMINFIVWLIVGGIIGWLASLVMRTDAQQGTLLNIVVGIVGAFIAGLVLTPLFGISNINSGNFSLPALLISLLGAIILLAIVNLFRRGSVR
jgi:uncharacterized membrane protein YeaQ/YmgE (transglycosylase-associated protein family)